VPSVSTSHRSCVRLKKTTRDTYAVAAASCYPETPSPHSAATAAAADRPGRTGTAVCHRRAGEWGGESTQSAVTPTSPPSSA